MRRVLIVSTPIAFGNAVLAQTGMGFGRSSTPGAGEVLAGTMLIVFAVLLLWGFFTGADALLPPLTLSPQRRFALRWTGLNRLEPSITTFLLLIVVITRVRAESSGASLASPWFALPALTFLGTLLPPVWFSSSQDAVIQRTWRVLRQIAVARVSPYLLLGMSLALDQVWLGVASMLIGLGSLFWSLRVLARVTTRLNTITTRNPQPVSILERIPPDAS